ncbi:MAG TPA: guanitoxin biosynthesis heme-dependent pre-guanitoxin N-hydroxylase GntA [Chitinophagaceae bacterium]
MVEKQIIINEYLDYLKNKNFPCIGAKAALAKQQISCMVAGNLACPQDDLIILEFLYDFTDDYRSSTELYHSAVILFKEPANCDEKMFDHLLWQRLQALSDLDATRYCYDKRVSPDPASEHFSFSLKQEAFFIICLHPASSRPARQFHYPAIVFNPHAQFEKLRQAGMYEKLKHSVRKRDIAFSGSINPMLKDYGEASEAYQYSGRQYDETWQCPLKIKHG